jgi:acyl-[acyl-carrier-protein] desaturase
MAYAAFQELATRISHRNTGRYSDDPVADKIMVRVAADENLHMMFYRDIVAAALQVDPSAAVQAITGEVLGFDMPGVVSRVSPARPCRWPGPASMTCVSTMTRSCGRCCATGTCSASKACPQAEQARDRLAAHLAKIDRLASRFEAKRAATANANEQRAAG